MFLDIILSKHTKLYDIAYNYILKKNINLLSSRNFISLNFHEEELILK